TLENRHIQKKNKIANCEKNEKSHKNNECVSFEERSKKDTFLEETELNEEENTYTSKVGPFQLVVIKLPWYKRAFKSLMGFLGLNYEFYEF
ncbi:MAG: hypothetical protein K2H53_02860, partial [Clostridia bacterium]|nr:hypothetical protein [Clostridia bacterium]